MLQAQEDDRQADRKRGQAALVFAVVQEWVPHSAPQESYATVEVSNVSQEPVWNCTVAVGSEWSETPLRRRFAGIEVLPPGKPFTVSIPIEMLRFVPDEATPEPPVFLWFRDTAGRHWYRTPKGQLEQSTGERSTRPEEAEDRHEDEG